MRFVNRFNVIVICGLSLLLINGPAVPATPDQPVAVPEYPHRSSFPEVPIIDAATLANRFANVVTVDVRSQYEYDTLRVNDAVNVPLTDKRFADIVKTLRRQFGDRPLVFYCNGKTCKKSYDAARLAIHAGISNVYCFDAGIQEWATQYPERTTLLGRTPIKSADVISSTRFKGHILPAKEFESRIGPQSLVLDIRDMAQRDIALFPFREERVPLDQKQRLDTIVERAKAQNKMLLVYDKAGHQIQWFQYYLEHKGLTQYYFLKGGAEGYFEATLGAKIGLNK